MFGLNKIIPVDSDYKFLNYRKNFYIASCFAILLSLVLLFFKGNSEDGSNGMVAFSFIVGAIASGLAGFLGMKVATKANNRTTNAAREGLAPALNVAFTGGSVMGMSVVGLGVLGLTILFIFYSNYFGSDSTSIKTVLNVISGYGEECGEPLLSHPDVRKITFTGSFNVGKIIEILLIFFIL